MLAKLEYIFTFFKITENQTRRKKIFPQCCCIPLDITKHLISYGYKCVKRFRIRYVNQSISQIL